jgi:four helix bundle protein
MRRAAVSIPANIAEGHARDSTKEFLHHISISLGSLAELETMFILAQELGYSDAAEIATLLQ